MSEQLQCPHCENGQLVNGLSYHMLLRCNNFVDCGRYVIA